MIPNVASRLTLTAVVALLLAFVAAPALAQSQGVRVRPPGPYVPTYRLGIIDSRPVVLPIGGRNMPGLRVMGVEPRSPAAMAGLETGDVLLTVNGQLLRDPDVMKQEMVRARGILNLKVRDVRLSRVIDVSVVVPPGTTSPAPAPIPGPERPITVGGILQLGVVAIGGETTGAVVDDGRGTRWELDFRHRPDLRARLKPLDRRGVVVTGRPIVTSGIEVPVRSLLLVDDLRPAGIVPQPRANAGR